MFIKDDDLMVINRRQFLLYSGVGLFTFSVPGFISGCSKNEPLLRIASNVWPGYEFLYLARDKKYFNERAVRLVEVPSATVCIQSLAAGTIEGAMLTLDEVLSARAEGLDLRIVAVLDVSMGADVVLSNPAITSLSQLKGKRVGVEKSAVGAVMLDAALRSADLQSSDVETIYMTVNQHRDAYLKNEVDALVTFEPVKTQLLTEGAIQLYDSSQIPGRIIDVLAVLPKAIKSNPNAIASVVNSHFVAREYFMKNPEDASKIISRRLQINPADVPASYNGIELSDIGKNRRYLEGSKPELEQSVNELITIMKRAKLLPEGQAVSLSDLFDSQFLPINTK